MVQLRPRPDPDSNGYRQEPPFAMQVELVEGCPLRCSFCGLNGIRGPAPHHDYKFVTSTTVECLLHRLETSGWAPRIEFAMHGEPSVHPRLLEILKQFREHLGSKSHLMMTSNGAGFVRSPSETVPEALEFLNVLALDQYEGVSFVSKILENYGGSPAPLFYPENPRGNPHRRRKPAEHDLVIVQDISEATKGTHSSLNNHCGAGAPLDTSMVNQRCAKPFREISIRWDGNVAICCNDWRGTYVCGNIEQQSLDEIWNGLAFQAARRKLYHRQRDFGPCLGCNAASYRVGLLPDKKGKVTLPVPTQKDQQAIAQAMGHGPLALPVLRPWEVSTPTV